MEGYFMFQWEWFVYQTDDGGFIFKWGEAHGGALVLGGGERGSKKIVRWRGHLPPMPPKLWETLVPNIL